MNLRDLRRILYQEWPDIEQDAKVRVLKAHPKEPSARYHSRVLYSTAMDYMRRLERMPTRVPFDTMDSELLVDDVDVTLDIKRAFSRLFRPAVARETMGFLLKKITWQEIAKKHHLSQVGTFRMLAKRRALLRRELRDYAPRT